ncbi:hypothetical protein [Nostoc sp. 'Peltigera malacea cyanobiont' DB3992]|uniref:hypothetical protein n=1 Tax=Nostoc sp. 'Peltigera malacea cyanobiont' DB3992 TaxID=1206980 RepID=UPI00211E90A0|nr:hypothetical protein [Nostoc sp. 'Peltigera malacea cyanobiont' DB3992]
MSLRAERSEAWQSQSLRLLHFVPFSTRGCANGNAKGERNDELSYIYLDPPT